MRRRKYKLGSNQLQHTSTTVLHDGSPAGPGTGIFRQLDGGQLAPVAARHSRDEAQSLILSLEKFWPGPYILRDLSSSAD